MFGCEDLYVSGRSSFTDLRSKINRYFFWFTFHQDPKERPDLSEVNRNIFTYFPGSEQKKNYLNDPLKQKL